MSASLKSNDQAFSLSLEQVLSPKTAPLTPLPTFSAESCQRPNSRSSSARTPLRGARPERQRARSKQYSASSTMAKQRASSPLRPARPICWTYSSRERGIDAWMTAPISGRSMPIPKATVATMMRTLPSKKAASSFCRSCGCLPA